MLKKTLLLSGILSSILLISTIIFAKEESSSLFEGFNFPTGTIAKKFITESFDDLFNIFGSYSKLTESQKKDSWNRFKGKYVRWTGVVNYKGLTNDDWDRVGIRHNVDTNVELMFGNFVMKLLCTFLTFGCENIALSLSLSLSHTHTYMHSIIGTQTLKTRLHCKDRTKV